MRETELEVGYTWFQSILYYSVCKSNVLHFVWYRWVLRIGNILIHVTEGERVMYNVSLCQDMSVM